MLYLTESDVRALLPMAKTIELMEGVFQRLAAGTAQNQPRRRLVLPTGSALHYMVGSDGAYFGTKVYSTNPKFGANFFFLLYAAENAKPLALLEANYLGQIRTGAASGYATKLLARPDASTVGIIGSGFQARTQVEAMRAVRSVREVRIWSRSEEKRNVFARECDAIAVGTAEEAVRGAHIVVTATNAKEPVLESGWVADGAHVNAMGSNQPQRRELPTELIARADLVTVDSIEQAKLESGDLLLAAPCHLIELKDAPTRPSPKAVTIFKSNGIAAEDVVSAGYVYERALAEGRGTNFYS